LKPILKGVLIYCESFYLFNFFFFISNVNAKEKEMKNTLMNKENLIIVGLTVANPAISLGTVIANTGTLQKILSLVNITYSSIKGKSIAEEALSKTTNKNCLVKNLAERKEFCS